MAVVESLLAFGILCALVAGGVVFGTGSVRDHAGNNETGMVSGDSPRWRPHPTWLSAMLLVILLVVLAIDARRRFSAEVGASLLWLIGVFVAGLWYAHRKARR